MMFDGFALEIVKLADAMLRVRHGGAGPPLLLLHGHPRTHTTWHRVAPILARRHTVICPDLPGFGQSSVPADAWESAGSSKRAKAGICVALMHRLGFDRFAVAGHDRGALTAFRMAMDHPASISHLVEIDGIPVLEHLERCDSRFATEWWHWFFFAQPDKPERAINVDPQAWYGGSAEAMGKENFEDYQTAINSPHVVHGMLEDYRAALTIDRRHDAEDRAQGLRVECPTLVLWSLRDDLERLYGDVLAIWRPWARHLQGQGIDSGHHVAEEAPDLLAKAILDFLA